MRYLKKSVCFIVLAAVFLTLFSGCKKQDVAVTNNGELPYVTLKCYIVGDPSPKKEEVLNNLNKMLKKKINAELDIVEIPWSDYKKKYSLILASGENIDLIYTSSWCYFYTEARKGAFMPLEKEMLEKYAPETMKNIPEGAWDYVKIDGKISMLPQPDLGITSKALVYREDLRKKYNIPEIKSFNDIETYFRVIKEKEPGMFPLNATVGALENLLFAYMWQREGYKPIHLTNMLVVGADDKESKITPLYDTASYREWFDIAKRWNEKGYWSKDILSNKTSPDNAFLNGTSASTICQMTSNLYSQSKMYSMHPDWEMGTYIFDYGGKLTTSSYVNNGMAIPATSKNPERALMAYDLLTWDKDFYIAHSYGIEGETYEMTGDGYIKMPEGANASDSYKFGGLGIRMGTNNTKFNLEDPSSAQEEYVKYVLDPDAAAKYGKDVPAVFIPYDVSIISGEMASLENAYRSFNNLYMTGMGTGSVNSQLKKFKKEAELAGIKKIIDELETQKEQFLKNK